VRVLIFAYDFPPVQSAQSLRWYYLANELAHLGWEIDIISADLFDIWGFNGELAPQLRVFRSYAGVFMGLASALAAKRALHAKTSEQRPDTLQQERLKDAATAIYRFTRRALDAILVPDVRAEWLPSAWRTACRLQREKPYDLVISSHEPAVDLILGLRAKRSWAVPLIADLADPLFAPYTRWWKKPLLTRLERTVCQYANIVTVTNEAFRQRLLEAHKNPQAATLLLSQGFAPSREMGSSSANPPPWPADRKKPVLLFTGNLYPGLREPQSLADVLESCDDVEAVFVGDVGPLKRRLSMLQLDRVTLLGPVDHFRCLALQREADILLNVGNRAPFQVPGKVFEYFGAARPILHISLSASDPVPSIIESCGRGVSVNDSFEPLFRALDSLVSDWKCGILDSRFNLSENATSQYRWASLNRFTA